MIMWETLLAKKAVIQIYIYQYQYTGDINGGRNLYLNLSFKCGIYPHDHNREAHPSLKSCPPS